MPWGLPRGSRLSTTVDAAGQPVGMTVSSSQCGIAYLLLVLWSLGRATSLYPVFASRQHYAIHVLALEQEALARRFASKVEQRFAGVDWQANAQGVPIIPGGRGRV